MKRKVSGDEIFLISGEGSNGLLDKLLDVYVIALFTIMRWIMWDKLYQVWHYTKLGIDTVCGNSFENEKMKIGWMV